MILFLKHISIEGPGTIGSFFEKLNRPMQILELQDQVDIPEDLQGIEAIVSLGGPMNVYEEEQHPFLTKENIFLQKALKAEIPMLGICLGSQLIAKACEAKVQKNPVKEIGWFEIQLTLEGRKDPLFEGLSDTVSVFQWHEDTFAIPREGKHLATSPECVHQAFKIGQNAYGLQFHVEVTGDIIETWIKRYFKVEDAREHREGKIMLEQYATRKIQFDQQAEQIYRNFSRLINSP